MNLDIQQEKGKMEKEAREFEKSPWVFFVRKNKLTYLIIIFLIIFGLLTIKTLPKELNPEVQIPIAVVATVYPGASPTDVEQQVTEKIESQVGDLEGVKRLTSTSSLGVSSVVVEFEAGSNLDSSIRKLKDKVDQVTELPDDAMTPNVVEISLSDQPVLTAALSGESYDLIEIKNFGENLKDKLKGIPYVSDVKVIGGQEKEIRVDIDPAKLSQYGLSVSQVIGQISANNIDFPIGSVQLENYNYSVRFQGQFKQLYQIGAMVVGSKDDTPVYLSDVATVTEGLSREYSKSRLSVNGGDPQTAVSIQIYKKTGGDITAVVDEAKKRIEEARGSDYPNDLNVAITLDLSQYITESINTLSANGLQTVLLILVLLFFFLGWREALIAGLSVPFSFFVAFITMSLFGESLNFISLFSLVLALGLLVDSAVVIVEGMYEKVANFGFTGYQSALLTIKEYAAPLLSGMLTTVAAFFPLLFVIGIFGEFIKTLPIVVISTLTAALFVSLTIIPAVGASFMNPVKNGADSQGITKDESQTLFAKFCRRFKSFCKGRARKKRIASRIFDYFAGKYYNFLPKVIGSKKNRRLLIGGTWLLLVVSFALPALGFLKIQSFAPADSNYFFINLKMPNGTVLERTNQVAVEIENTLRSEPQVVNFVTSVGAGLGLDPGSSSQGSISSGNKAFFQVNLVKKENRDEKSAEIVDRVRRELDEKITQGEITVQEEQSGPPSGSAVEARVQGDDLLVLGDLATKIKDQLAQIPTVIEPKTSIESSSGELVFVPNKDVLSQNGLSVAQVGAELRAGVNRNSDENIKKSGDEIAIDVGYEEDRLKTIEGLKGISIKTPTGKTMYISELGKLEFTASLASISHYDKDRTVTITASTQGGNPTEITNALKEKINNLDIPSGYKVEFGGESQDLQETFTDMFTKMIIGIILILFILIIQFNSYRQVLIILFTIPLAMIGVILGMAASRLIVDIPSFIGIVSLAGIVVNNAIILIDEINRQLKQGGGLVESVRNAGKIRLRPVFLTTITTVFGLLPLSITQPDWRNMGFAIIFGLTFSTFLTLIVVPTMYVSFYWKKYSLDS